MGFRVRGRTAARAGQLPDKVGGWVGGRVGGGQGQKVAWPRLGPRPGVMGRSGRGSCPTRGKGKGRGRDSHSHGGGEGRCWELHGQCVGVGRGWEWHGHAGGRGRGRELHGHGGVGLGSGLARPSGHGCMDMLAGSSKAYM